MVRLMIVPECFSRDAAGYREQTYPQSILIRVHDINRIAFADPITKQVQWDGSDMSRADLPPSLAACLAHPEVKALVDAVSFLVGRGCEFELSDDADQMATDYMGHIEPALARVCATLAAIVAKAGGGA